MFAKNKVINMSNKDLVTQNEPVLKSIIEM